MKKRTFEQIERINSRIAKFRSKLTKRELYNVGMSKEMRPIPQILRFWLILNTNKFVEIDEMMDRYVNTSSTNDKYNTNWSPLLQNIKRHILHDRARAIKDIDDYIEQLYRGTFHFECLSPIEQMWLFGIDGYDTLRIFTEELGSIKWSSFQLIPALRTLRNWVKNQPDYLYPAEQFIKAENEGKI